MKIYDIQKKFRHFLTYDGKYLSAIDIGNSHPYLMCLLFNPLFWEYNSDISLNISMLPNNIQSLFSIDHLAEIRNYVTERLMDNEELDIYMEKASRGNIYEHITEVSNAREGTHLVRGDTKEMMQIVFYSKNHFFYQKGAELKRLFAALYPRVYGLIRLIKRDNHAAFACLLQSVESEIILHRCCKRIWDEKPYEVPIFTIHDSIATTVEHQDYVYSVMKEVLTACIGIRPDLKPEEWHPSKLDESSATIVEQPRKQQFFATA